MEVFWAVAVRVFGCYVHIPSTFSSVAWNFAYFNVFFKKNIVIVHLLYCKQQGGVCLGFASCECKSRVTLMEHNTVEALQPQQTQFCGDERQSVMRLH